MTRPTAAHLVSALIADEAGFVVSAELVLVATLGVLAMIVGLSEVALNINNELEDIGSAFGSISQSYRAGGLSGHGGYSGGSSFDDRTDFCDSACDVGLADPVGETK